VGGDACDNNPKGHVSQSVLRAVFEVVLVPWGQHPGACVVPLQIPDGDDSVRQHRQIFVAEVGVYRQVRQEAISPLDPVRENAKWAILSAEDLHRGAKSALCLENWKSHFVRDSLWNVGSMSSYLIKHRLFKVSGSLGCLDLDRSSFL
jgi:hypothetical protein